MFFIAYLTYSKVNQSKIGYVSHRMDFILLTFTAIFEPDPIRWFVSWSTGKFLLLLWMVMGLTLSMAYTCNLRAIMTATDFEKPVNKPEDVLERRQTVYLPKELEILWYLHVWYIINIQ